jgi:rRNA-processing protein FCF1
MIRIILDTNFLVYCAKQKIDYVEEISKLMKSGFELITISLVVIELEKLAKEEKKLLDRDAAKMAFKILKTSAVKIIPVEGDNTDNEIIKLSKGNIVATLDRELKSKIEKSIIIREGKKIEFS